MFYINETCSCTHDTAIPIKSESLDSSEETDNDSDQYIAMSPGQGNITSDDSGTDDDGDSLYLPMNPLTEEE